MEDSCQMAEEKSSLSLLLSTPFCVCLSLRHSRFLCFSPSASFPSLLPAEQPWSPGSQEGVGWQGWHKVGTGERSLHGHLSLKAA